MAEPMSGLSSLSGFMSNPVESFEELHRRGPVQTGEKWCLVVGYEAAQATLRDHRTLSSDVLATFGFGGGDMAPVLSRSMPFTDPPDHTRLRGVVQRAFSPKALAGLEGRIREMTRQLLDQMVPGEPFEVMSGLARPLPVMVIADMLGLDVSSLDTKHWSDPNVGMMAMTGMLPGGDGLFSDVIDARRREPRDDVISLLVQAEADGTIDSAEVVASCAILFTAGNVTTTGLIGNGVHLLAEHPDQCEAVAADNSLIPNAVEEVLRFDPPIPAVPPRRAIVDTTVAGHAVSEGSIVTVFSAAANRDPAQFEDPERFDISRTNAISHVAFGAGIHFCIGAPLSRIEGRIVLEELLARAPRMTLAARDEADEVGGPFDGNMFLRARRSVLIDA